MKVLAKQAEEDDRPEPPKPQPDRKTTSSAERQHSMMRTLLLHIDRLDDPSVVDPATGQKIPAPERPGSTPTRGWFEQAHIPPVVLIECKAPYLFCGVLMGFLMLWKVGTGYQTAFEDIAKTCSTMLVQIVSDSVSANILAIAHLAALFLLDPALRDCAVMVWPEPCSIHQLARVSMTILTRHKLNSAIYQLTRLQRMKKVKKELRAVLKALMQSTWFHYVRGPPPEHPHNTPQFRAAFVDLLSTPEWLLQQDKRVMQTQK